MTKKISTKVIVETALLTAFAFILDYLQGIICDFMPFWPNGGSVGIAMVPIFILAIRRGVIPGVLGGMILGLIDMIDGIWISPGQHVQPVSLYRHQLSIRKKVIK